MAFVLHALRNNDLFVDVGANVGTYTVLASAVVGAEVIAFEPVPSTYVELQLNIALNGVGERVHAHNVGLADREGQLVMTVDQGARNQIIANPAGFNGAELQDVPISTLDVKVAGGRPTLLKIDVEGYETQVLDGGMSLLQDESTYGVIVENNLGSDTALTPGGVFHQKMLDFGFTDHTYDPFSRTLRRWSPAAANNQYDCNLLFIRDPAMVASRVQSAPRFLLRNAGLTI
ncbi:MAG: FkbM family methyltransferase [Rubripirellula sp.]